MELQTGIKHHVPLHERCIVQYSNVNSLKVPSRFTDYFDKVLPARIDFRNWIGNIWPVQITSDGGVCNFTVGLDVFCDHNNVEIGDNLIITYCGGLVFGIDIFSKLGFEKKLVNTKLPTTVYFEKVQFPNFQAIVKKYNIEESYLTIPHDFWVQHINGTAMINQTTAILIFGLTRCYVGITEENNTIELREGFCAFVQKCNISVQDFVSFELMLPTVQESHIYFKVFILV